MINDVYMFNGYMYVFIMFFYCIKYFVGVVNGLDGEVVILMGNWQVLSICWRKVCYDIL